ncbi:unnamed protein product [Rhizophagus irregularis]|nr:unnamed protein product [Rhizophagus irregularis]
MYFKYVDAISAQRIIRSVPIEKTDLFNQQMQSARRGVTREILIKQYLDYLVEYDDILRKKDENMGGMYIIRYNEICESLKKEIFEDVIMEKYGFKGVRIVRLLYEKSKLDEKAIVNIDESFRSSPKAYRINERGFCTNTRSPTIGRSSTIKNILSMGYRLQKML